MYSCERLCIAVDEVYAQLWRAMYSCRGLCIAMESYVKLWRATDMYGCVGL